MLNLKEFGEALRTEREKASYSLANFAKHTGGISKDDIRDFEAGKKVPDKLSIKKLVHCFPILTRFENELRHEAPREPEVKERKIKHAPAREPTRLQSTPRIAPRAYSKPRLEIVRQHEVAPEILTAPLAPVLKQALRKTKPEMLGELARTATKKLTDGAGENYDFTIKNDGKALVIKLWLTEGEEERVDSGCYLTVSERGSGLGVFCKTMTNGNYDGGRSEGVVALLEVAEALHNAVKERRFE